MKKERLIFRQILTKGADEMDTSNSDEQELIVPKEAAAAHADGSDTDISSVRADDFAAKPEKPLVLQGTGYTPDETAETARRAGLAWSAGIVFFTSIAFMLFLGWIADILLGSAPWGLVGGIVLGSIIGFIQFFRLSSKIFAKNDASASPKTLFKDDEENR